MAWTVSVLSPAVEREIESLPKDMQAKLLRIVTMIETQGLERMLEPYVKHLEAKLWKCG